MKAEWKSVENYYHHVTIGVPYQLMILAVSRVDGGGWKIRINDENQTQEFNTLAKAKAAVLEAAKNRLRNAMVDVIDLM